MSETGRKQAGERGTLLYLGGRPVCLAQAVPGAEDAFERLEEGVYRWTRRTQAPVGDMCMRLSALEPMRFGMVPAVSYDGNPWGDRLDYVGFTDGQTGLPWRWAYHRAAVPGATYSQGDAFGVGMFLADLQSEAACSLYPQDGSAVHEMLWPLQEGPRVYHQKRDWRGPTRAAMPPCSRFSVIVVLSAGCAPRFGYERMLSFAWKQAARDVPAAYPNEELIRLGLAYAKRLYTVEADGFRGFNIGLMWENGAFRKRTEHRYEIGWCGQNASYANSLLYFGMTRKHPEDVATGLTVLDAWEAARLPGGLTRTHYDGTAFSQGYGRVVDACNLGTAALQWMEGYDLAKRAGAERPRYLAAARAICDFAVSAMAKSGCIGKSWRESDLSPAVKEGTVGAFLTMALAAGAKRFDERTYLEAAEKSHRYYAGELESRGFTTAGALDIYCVDKESALPLLKAGLMLYETTANPGYLAAARRAALYLSTWQWHYSRAYPAGSLLHQLRYNTFGGTAVSTTHQHHDPFALCYATDLIDLARLTGEESWAERARAVWRNGQQCVSDGTLVVDGHLRPAGSQDEGMAYTEWGPVNEPTRWLVAWPGAFRLEALRRLETATGERQAAYAQWLR